MSTPSITEAFPVLMMGYGQAAGSNFLVSLVIHRSHGTPHLGDLCLLARRFAGWSAQSPPATSTPAGVNRGLDPGCGVGYDRACTPPRASA
jgi:hypothetical protein